MKLYFQKVLLVSGSIFSIFIATYLTNSYIFPCRASVDNSQSDSQVNPVDIGDKVGSLLAGLSAVVAVGYSIWEYKQQQKQQQASETRKVLRVIATGSMELFYRLEHGSCLTVAASTITKEFKCRLSDSPTSDEIINYLEDEILMESVATVGWHLSPLTLKCEEFINQLKQNLIPLNGGLCIIAEAVKLYTKIIKYKCSPEIFKNTLVSNAKSLDRNEKDISKIINNLNNELQKCSISECVVKYNDELSKINKFICDLSYALIDLDDRLLLKISKIKSPKESKMINESKSEGVDDNIFKSERIIIEEITNHAASLKSHLDELFLSKRGFDKSFQEKIQKLKQLAQCIEDSVKAELEKEPLSSDPTSKPDRPSPINILSRK